MANIKVCDICGKELPKQVRFKGYQPVVPRYEIHEIGHLNKSKILDLCAGCEKAMGAWVKANTESEIETIPPVPPTERTGEWKLTMTHYPYCSECEWMPEEDEMTHGYYKFCPECGVKMKG